MGWSWIGQDRVASVARARAIHVLLGSYVAGISLTSIDPRTSNREKIHVAKLEIETSQARRSIDSQDAARCVGSPDLIRRYSALLHQGRIAAALVQVHAPRPHQTRPHCHLSSRSSITRTS